MSILVSFMLVIMKLWALTGGTEVNSAVSMIICRVLTRPHRYYSRLWKKMEAMPLAVP